jgi:hypothetical protein
MIGRRRPRRRTWAPRATVIDASLEAEREDVVIAVVIEDDDGNHEGRSDGAPEEAVPLMARRSRERPPVRA